MVDFKYFRGRLYKPFLLVTGASIATDTCLKITGWIAGLVFSMVPVPVPGVLKCQREVDKVGTFVTKT